MRRVQAEETDTLMSRAAMGFRFSRDPVLRAKSCSMNLWMNVPQQ